MPPSDALDAALLEAHASQDRAALIRLYARAGDMAERQGRADAAGFYLTHAYVCALETGDAAGEGLHAQLVATGREE